MSNANMPILCDVYQVTPGTHYELTVLITIDIAAHDAGLHIMSCTKPHALQVRASSAPCDLL